MFENFYKFENILPGMCRKVNISTLMVFRNQRRRITKLYVSNGPWPLPFPITGTPVFLVGTRQNFKLQVSLKTDFIFAEGMNKNYRHVGLDYPTNL
jgi:hypothetical protein